MGQKVNPHGLRVGVIKDWDSRWFTSKRDFGDTLVEDYKLRKQLKKQLYNAGVPKIEIERTFDSQTGKPRVRVTVHCSKPGMVIGKGGAEKEKLQAQLTKQYGIKAQVGGRLAGADIARSESYHEGTIPLQTLRADIDYGFAEADTTYGKIGVKVWIYKGEVLKGAKPVEPEPRFERRERRAPRTRREGGNK